MVPVFLEPLATSSHPVLQVIPNLVSFLGVVSYCSGVVLVVVTSVVPAVFLWLFVPLLLVGCSVLVFVWACSFYIWLVSAKFSSCAWLRLCESFKLMIVMSSIASLSLVVTFVGSCSAFAIIIWVSVSCAWFDAEPCTWEVCAAFLRVWKCMYACVKWFFKSCQVFCPTGIYSQCSQSFFHYSSSEYQWVCNIDHFSPWDWHIFIFGRLDTSSICWNKSTIGSTRDHSWFTLCSLYYMSMGEIVSCSSYRFWMISASVWLA